MLQGSNVYYFGKGNDLQLDLGLILELCRLEICAIKVKMMMMMIEVTDLGILHTLFLTIQKNIFNSNFVGEDTVSHISLLIKNLLS